MPVKPLSVMLIPDLNSVGNNLGYDMDNEDAYGDAALFAQGYYIDQMQVKPGDKFSITNNFERATINCENTILRLKNSHKAKEIGIPDYYEEGERFDLPPGSYIFHEDGRTVEFLDDNGRIW